MGRRQQIIQHAYNLGQAWRGGRTPLRPRIRIITAFDAAIAGSGNLAAANLSAYAVRHGYDFRSFRDGFDRSRPAPWSKILFTLQALRGTDWVVWIDADILIMNQAERLEGFLSADHDFVIAQHHAPNLHANTGVYFARSRLWVRCFLRHVYAQRSVINHGWWEQAAVNILLDNYRLPRVRVIERARTFNALYASPAAEDVYQSGDFLVHFAGRPDKTELMRRFAAKIDQP
jgi:hypothetical protein